MEPFFYFTDKDRPYRTYHTIDGDVGDDNNWVCDRPDITELQDIWAEDIMQGIIDGFTQCDFEVCIYQENNDEEEYHWLRWELMTAWDGWS